MYGIECSEYGGPSEVLNCIYKTKLEAELYINKLRTSSEFIEGSHFRVIEFKVNPTLEEIRYV